MPAVKYLIELTDEERKKLLDIVSSGKAAARTILKANILLASDRNGKKPMTVQQTAETYHTTATTVQNIRAQFCKQGIDAVPNRKKRETPPVPSKMTGDVEAKLIALACHKPPEGYAKWTVRLLADKLVELEIVESISYVTVQSILKKRNSTSPEESMVHTKSAGCCFCCQYGRCP